MSYELLNKEINNIVSRKFVYVIDDIIKITKYLDVKYDELHVFFAMRNYDGVGEREYIYLPTMSFSVISDKIIRYKHYDEIEFISYKYCVDKDCLRYSRFGVDMFVVGDNVDALDNKRYFDAYYDFCYFYYMMSDALNNAIGAFGHKKAKEIMKRCEGKMDFAKICEYISKLYGLSVVYLLPKDENSFLFDKSIYRSIQKVLSASDIAYHVNVSMKKRQRYTNYSNISKTYYAIFPIVDRMLIENPVRGALLLISKKNKIEYGCLNTVQELAYRVLLAYNKGQKMIIADLQRKFPRMFFDISEKIITSEVIECELKNYAEECVRGIVEYSNAYSAVLRVYDPSKNILKPIAYYQNEHGKYSKGAPKNISVSGYKRSVNAFCYNSANINEYIYIRNVNQIEDDYINRGLLKVLKKRKYTVSEICLPLDRYGLRIGTINIESSIEAAFDNDIEFIDSIVKMFIDFYGQINAIKDAEWLSKMSFKHINYHKLMEFARKLDIDKREELQAIILDYEGKEEMIDEKEIKKQYMMSEILADINYYAVNLLINKNKRNIVKVNGDVIFNVPKSFAVSFKLIMTSLIDNSDRHSDLRRDKFIVSIYDKPSNVIDEVKYSELYIIYKSIKLVEKDVAEKLFISPFYKSDYEFDEAGVRYGMFLIGVHARLLGGSVTISGLESQENEIPLNVIIRLPIKKH